MARKKKCIKQILEISFSKKCWEAKLNKVD